MYPTLFCAFIAFVSIALSTTDAFPCDGQHGGQTAAVQQAPQGRNHSQRRMASVGSPFAERVKSFLNAEPGIEETGEELKAEGLRGQALEEFRALQSKAGENFPAGAHLLMIDGKSVVVVSQMSEAGMSVAAFLPGGTLIAKGLAAETGEFTWQ